MTITNTHLEALWREIDLLKAWQTRFKLSSGSIIRQLTEDALRPLPDVLPNCPAIVPFKWPGSNEVDLRVYWQKYDHKQQRSTSS